MIAISGVLIYLAIVKSSSRCCSFHSFGMLLANLPLADLMVEEVAGSGQPGGLLGYLYLGVKKGIYPSLIFLGIGAMTDFGPLIARPSSLFCAAAQFGIYVAFVIAISWVHT